MKNIILISNSDRLLHAMRCCAAFEGLAVVGDGSDGAELQLNNGDSYIVAQLNGDISRHCDDKELDAYTVLLGQKPVYYFDIRFDDGDLMARLIVSISRTIPLVVDNDHGLIIDGQNFSIMYNSGMAKDWYITPRQLL